MRRVAVTLNLYKIPFERRVLSVFTDFDSMLETNPLGKVPVLELDDGERLFDSRAILDYLDGQAHPDNRLLPADEPHRRHVLRIEAVALGLAEKTYERGIEIGRKAPGTGDPDWVERVERQMRSASAWLDGLRPSPWFHGNRLTRADVTAAIAATYMREKALSVAPPGSYPALERHCLACEALEEFRAAAYSATEAARSGWSPTA